MTNKPIRLVCIIDDDVIYQLGMNRFLQSQGFCEKLLTFHNGHEALDFFNENMWKVDELPDVIFLDINMPVLDGWQFLDQFSSMGLLREFRLYVVSSSIDPADRHKASSYPVVSGYLTKPIRPEHLQSIMTDF